MTKEKFIYICQACGYQSHKWLGKCPECDQWNSFLEELIQGLETHKISKHQSPEDIPIPLDTIEYHNNIRISSYIAEFDRVLGGGIVPGSVVLLGGDPGVGKSTLLLQVMNNLGKSGLEVLYISGEESKVQIKMRAARIGITSSQVKVLSETHLNQILLHISQIKPNILVTDSIQTLQSEDIQAIPGSVSQIRGVSSILISTAKKMGIATFLIGHITKEGSIAGPKLLEHMVDTVLYFEGDKDHSYRILKAVKNRYGPTNEIGVFEMSESGLLGVSNPSELFLSEIREGVSGSAVAVSMEGNRAVLVEIQALVCPTNYAMPRRTTMGIDYNRVSLLLAILEKRSGLNLSNQDVFVNVAGGLKITEPAVDLAIIAAIISSLQDTPIPKDTALFGEVGLTGEIRRVSHGETRVKELVHLGFKRCILPLKNSERIKQNDSLEFVKVDSIRDLLNILFL